jgi:cell division septation protein DedD
MRVNFTTPLILVTLATVPACVTSRPHGTAPRSTAKTTNTANKAKPLAKEGQKTQDATAAAAGVAQSPESTAVQTDLTRTFTRLSDPTMRLMDEDLRVATALHPAPKGTMEEAVVILAQLRLLKIQTEQSSKFQSRDLYEEDNAADAGTAAAGSRPSMEKQFSELGIDLVSSFDQNQHLKTLPSLALVKKLLETTSNSVAFQNGMQSIIDHEAQKWAALQNTAQPETPVTPEPAAAPVEATAETAPSAEPMPAPVGDVQTGPADLKRSDAILMQSQRLADKGAFKQAIDFAARIDNRDPFFDQAKEKIKIYSNRAVQDLRQKAAQAFQNAMPVADNRAKAAYLKQAKELLEQALQDYPVADQLDTVRDNLAVITRDLSGIDQEAGDNTPNTQ